MNYIYSEPKNIPINNEDIELIQTNNSIPEFSLDGLIKKCKVVSIYDGDTIKVVFKHFNTLNKWTIRMTGYDSPEIRPRLNIENRTEKIENAKKSRDYLKNLIMNENQLVYLKCGKFDKYGRLLGYIYLNDPTFTQTSVNDIMIENNMGYRYNGGAKKI
jgi:endonuclease YncB( thermonuclease family)